MPKQYGPGMSFAFGGLAGSFACVLSNPFEVVKTRFQLQGELARGAKPYRSLGHAFVSILKSEGVAGVQRGLVPGIVFQVVCNGIRIGLFDHAKRMLHSDACPVATKLAAGALIGGVSAAVSSPLFLIKARLQAQSAGALAVGTQHGYKGMVDGLVTIARDGGLRGLYKGVDAFVYRTSFGSAFQLAGFDMLKDPCQKSLGSWNGAVVASAAAGLITTAAMNPFDVVMTRLYNQPYSAAGVGELYSGPVDCMLKSLKAEGPGFMAKGLGPHATRLVPHTIYCLVFFEKVKQAAEYVGL